MTFDANVKLLLIVKQCRAEGKPLEDFLNLLVESIQGDIKYQTNTKLLAEITAVLADANAQNFINTDILSEIVQVAKRVHVDKFQESRYFINIVMHAAQMGVVKDNTISNLFDSVNKFKYFQKAVVAQDDMKQYGVACLEFLLSLSNDSKSSVPQAVLTRQISPKHGLPGNIQAIHNLAMLDYILELDFPPILRNQTASCSQSHVYQN